MATSKKARVPDRTGVDSTATIRFASRRVLSLVLAIRRLDRGRRDHGSRDWWPPGTPPGPDPVRIQSRLLALLGDRSSQPPCQLGSCRDYETKTLAVSQALRVTVRSKTVSWLVTCGAASDSSARASVHAGHVSNTRRMSSTPRTGVFAQRSSPSGSGW